MFSGIIQDFFFTLNGKHKDLDKNVFFSLTGLVKRPKNEGSFIRALMFN